MKKVYTVNDLDNAIEEHDYETVYKICKYVDALAWRPGPEVLRGFSITTMQDGWWEPANAIDFRRVRNRFERIFGGTIKI